MRRCRQSVVLCVVLVAMAGPVAAQSSGWQLAPRAGVFVPTTGLGNVPVSTQIVTAVETGRSARLSAGVAVGLSLLRQLNAEGTALRFDLDYVPPVRVSVDGYGGSFPVEASMATVMAGIERSLTPARDALRPYMTVSAGLRSYAFQPWLSHGPQFPGGQASLAARVGGGVVMKVSVLSVSAELTDQLSAFRFDDGGRRMMNDVHALLGMRVGLF